MKLSEGKELREREKETGRDGRGQREGLHIAPFLTNTVKVHKCLPSLYYVLGALLETRTRQNSYSHGMFIRHRNCQKQKEIKYASPMWNIKFSSRHIDKVKRGK